MKLPSRFDPMDGAPMDFTVDGWHVVRFWGVACSIALVAILVVFGMSGLVAFVA